MNLEVKVEMNKSNTTKTKQIDAIMYCNCDGKSGVESTNCLDLGNGFKIIM